MFHLFPEDEESVLIKPRARSTASGKKIPAGAVSIFGGESFSFMDLNLKWLPLENSFVSVKISPANLGSELIIQKNVTFKRG